MFPQIDFKPSTYRVEENRRAYHLRRLDTAETYEMPVIDPLPLATRSWQSEF